MSDPGDEWMEDPTQTQDREIVEGETQERRQRLFELAHAVDTDSAREDAIDALEGVKRSHEPPPPPKWVGRL